MSPNIYPDKDVLATIQSYDSNSKTYTLLTQGAKGQSNNAGGRTLKGVPRKVTDPSDKSVLSNSTTVIVSFDLGVPVIDGVIPVNASRKILDGVPDTAPDVGGYGLVDVGEESAYSGGYYRQPGDPKNVFGGDWCRSSPDGNFMAALRGKLNKIYSSDRAQIITSGLHGLVRTVCDNYEHFSSFGNLTIYNKNGRCNLKFVGAADQLYENRDDNWTFHLDIGDEGKLFNMRVTSPDGRATNAEFSISPDGQVNFFGKTGWTLETAGTFKQTVGGDLARSVQGGDRKTIDGVAHHIYGSDLSQDVAENLNSNVGNNETNTVGGSQTNIVSKNRVENIAGGPALLAKPTNIAYETNVLNGSYDVHVGSPAKLSNPLALAGYHVYTYNGSVVLGENMDPLNSSIPFTGAAGVSVSLNTRGLGSIGLGCRLPPFNNPITEGSNPPTDFAMLFVKWQIWANALIKLLDTHVHPTAWGPSLPAQVPLGTPLGFAAALSGLIIPVKSLRVVIGA